MTTLPRYEIRDGDDRLVAEADGYAAAAYTAAYVLAAGEETGPLATFYAGETEPLERARLSGGSVVWTTVQGRRETLR